MNDSYAGCQKTNLDPKFDYGMATSSDNARKRYGLLPGQSDTYGGVEYVKANLGFRVYEPLEIAGSYTSIQALKEAIDNHTGGD